MKSFSSLYLTLGQSFKDFVLSFVHTYRHELNTNRRDKISAIKRFLLWHINNFFHKGPLISPYVNHSMLMLKQGVGGRGIFFTGLPDSEMAFAGHVLRSEDLFIDIGANIGAYSVLSAATSKAKCIACEPISETFGYLEKNVRMNNLGALIKTKKVALGKEEGTILMTNKFGVGNYVVLNDQNEFLPTETVLITTLDRMMVNQTRTHTLIKIDVEGYESEVLDGSEATLREDGVFGVILELIGQSEKYGSQAEMVHQRMLNFGFLPYQYVPYERRLILLDGKDFSKKNPFDANVLYIKNKEFVLDRLKSGQAFEIWNKQI